MTDTYKIDSTKIYLHPDRVSQWQKGDIFPIYAEIAPSLGCNHHCIFCSFDYLNRKAEFLDAGVLCDFLSKASEMGLKSVMYAGEGEPLLHPDISGIIEKTKELGIDIAMTTNGVLFKKEIAEATLPNMSWIKFSVDSANSDTHSKIHGCPKEDFSKLMKNIKYATTYKKQKGLSCTIGAQLLMIPENTDEVYDAAKLYKKLGVDYFVIKPFTKHPSEISDFRNTVDYIAQNKLRKKLNKLETPEYSIIYRENAMSKLGAGKEYTECLGYKFWVYLDAYGNLYSCSAFLGNTKYCYGNIYKESLKDIWEGNRRKEVIELMKKVNVNGCREICRLDEVNRYLWELTHPSAHVNFI